MKRRLQWSLNLLLALALIVPLRAAAHPQRGFAAPERWPLSSLTAWGTIFRNDVTPLGEAGGVSTPTAEELLAKEWDLIYRTNLTRRDAGLPPLKFNPQLRQAALGHSQDMADHDFFSHTGSDGSTLAERVNRAGYTGWQLAGENIAAGFSEPWAVLYSWMQSDHRLNILSQYFNEIGIGLVYDAGDTFGPYYYYWTQDFGMRNTFRPVIINNEAYSTNSSQVSLYIYGSGWAEAMEVSNDPDFSGSNWQPYQTEMSWNLLPGNGVRTVYVRLRQGSSIVTVHDDILVEGVPPAPTWTPTPVPTPTWTPTPRPTPTPTATATPTPVQSGGEVVTFSTNGGTYYTRHSDLLIHLLPPSGASYAQLSDRQDFTGVKWTPVGQDIPWHVESTHSVAITLYSRYWLSSSESISPIYEMVIGYDVRPPWGALLSDESDPTGKRLLLPAQDDLSGVESMQVGPLSELDKMPWVPYAAVYNVNQGPTSQYAVRYRDRAGNVSGTVKLDSVALMVRAFIPWALY